MLMLFDGINNIHEVNLCNAKSLKSDALDNELINVFFFKLSSKTLLSDLSHLSLVYVCL